MAAKIRPARLAGTGEQGRSAAQKSKLRGGNYKCQISHRVYGNSAPNVHYVDKLTELYAQHLPNVKRKLEK